MRLTHEAIAQHAAQDLFSLEDTIVLVEHSNDPDRYDGYFDRFWKHFYVTQYLAFLLIYMKYRRQ